MYKGKSGKMDKRIVEYTQKDIFKQIGGKTPFKDLRKICAILGDDFGEKTKGIGPGTVMKKYKVTELTDKQKNSILFYKKIPQSNIITYNIKKKPFVKCNSDVLKKWLIEEKSFNADRMEKLFASIKM